jgi:hypothetical protein
MIYRRERGGLQCYQPSKTLLEKVKIQKSVGIRNEESFLSAISNTHKKNVRQDTMCRDKHDLHMKGYHKEVCFMH